MRMVLLTAAACAAAIGFFYHEGLAASGLDAPVRTTAGLVRADPTLENGVRVFRGIPFAAPPVGDRRWKEPAAPAKWEGVREARTFSKECVQAPSTDPLYSLYYPTEQPQGEDCLYLNVWTPARSAQDRLAVLVWIYGGGFVLGSGSQPVYNPVNLAKRGIVAVTFNYRVGIMGFFAHPELSKESGHDSSGNYGFLDQIAALKWVHNNIAAFGGDPNRITIAGHSAGAGSSSVLAVSPLAKGLVHRAIPQSLAPGRALGNARRQPRKDVEKAGEVFAAQLGASSIAELRKKSSTEIMAVPNARGFGFGPLVDGYVLPYDVENSYVNGVANDVQLMVGEVKDTVQLAASGRSHVTPEDLKKQVEQQFGSRADEFFRLFPIPPGADGGDVALKNANDAQGYWRAWKVAAVHARHVKSPTYLYYFTRVPPAAMADYHGVPGATPGAFHGAELSYMFDNLAYKKWAWTDGDRKLTNIMSSYWLNFINKGDPNGPGLPAWAKFTTTGQETIQIGDIVAPFRGPTEVINFFEKMPGTVGP